MQNFEQEKEQLQYEAAQKRVKKLKGYYVHLLVYVLVNIFIFIINIKNIKPGESYFAWHYFTTLFFWGIGLAAHTFSVFVPQFVFGKEWEERKINEFLEKQKKEKWE
jgi:uncharacterized integral membrane protein